MEALRRLLEAVLKTQTEIKTQQQTILTRLDALEESHHAMHSEQSETTSRIDTVGRIVARLGRRVHHSASIELLSTFELAGQILLQLDQVQLLALQRFSPIKAIINGSPLIQRKIFLLAQTTSVPHNSIQVNNLVLQSRETSQQSGYFFNALRPALSREGRRGQNYKLVLHAGHHFPTLRDLPAGYVWDAAKVLRLTNVSLRGSGPDTASGSPYLELSFDMLNADTEERAKVKGFLKTEHKGHVRGEDGRESWQKMFFTQPPTLKVKWTATSIYDKRDVLSGTVAPGTTFGDLLAESKRLG